MRFWVFFVLFAVGCSQNPPKKFDGTYTVKIMRPHSIWWTSFTNIKGDFVDKEIPDVRILITDNEERIEIPLKDTRFWFSSDRFLSIKKQMEKEAKQPLSMGGN